MSNELGDCRKGLDVMRSWLICPSTMFKKYPPDRPPTKSIPTRRGISRTFWILASFSVFFWKSAYHRLGPMGIFVKIHGISWNITLSILPDMAELIWFLLPGYKIAVLNMSYLINLIQDIWSIQQLDSSMVRHICAQCAILCSTWLRFKIATKWTSLACLLHGQDLLAGQVQQRDQPNRRCWQVDPFYNHDDDDRTRDDVTTKDEVDDERMKSEYRTRSEIFYGARVRARFWTQ